MSYYYRTSRYSCSDRMCGATDCENCYGPGAGDGPDPENSERPWLAESGYDLDEDGWSKVISSKRRTCRRAHQDGKVNVGDLYATTTTRYIDDETGESSLSHHKRIIKRAA